MAISKQGAHDLASRLAGWFFLALGAFLLALAVAIGTLSTGAALVLGIAGVAVLAFALAAPRNIKVTALEAALTFVFVLG